MSSPVKSKPEELLGLSLSEARLILLGTLCVDDSGKVDSEKLARRGNYKNAASASTSYRTAKRKLIDFNPDDQDASAANTPTKSVVTQKKGKGRPNKAVADDSAPATPVAKDGGSPSKAKRVRKTPAKPVAKIEESSSETEDDNDAIKTEPSSPIQPQNARPVKSEPDPVKHKPASVKSENGSSELMVSSDDEWVNKPLDPAAEWDTMQKAEGNGVQAKSEV
ncbi:hypothetical protein BDV59DRAFT_183514 [Aspergillus ambiguus]|uniref:putative histone h1.3 n=1 Tax=Aspergillus ambiguus TaxID=176160 RepID=UPI003CCD8168